MTTPVLTDPADVLEAAADLIERDGLYKGGYWRGWPDREYAPGTPCCALGAIAVVSDLRTQAACVHPASDVLRDYINRGRLREQALVTWSDARGRTAVKVAAAMRAAAQDWRAGRDPV